MHIENLQKWQHDHSYIDQSSNRKNEQRTLYVVFLTVIMMGLEISAGMIFNSMALLADGWHMATHAGALGLSVFAYRYARSHANDRTFTFGIGKVEILGGYTSSVILAIVALFMVWESVDRLLNPLSIAYNEAILVAIIGLLVNIVSAILLHGGDHHHHHGHGHHHGHTHSQNHTHDHSHAHRDDKKKAQKVTDHNLRAAYMHVLADALTSLLAIGALFFGKMFGWVWADAAMGLVGAFVIGKWSYGLLKETGEILLDRVEDPDLSIQIKALVEEDADNRLVDLHLWHIGGGTYAAIVSIVTHYPRSANHYKNLLQHVPHLDHITVEINICEGKPCMPIEGLKAAHP